MGWSIEYDPGALKDLKKLDRPIQREILDYMDHRVAAHVIWSKVMSRLSSRKAMTC